MSMRNRQNGQSLVEFALLVPLMFLFVVNVVNFGGCFLAYAMFQYDPDYLQSTPMIGDPASAVTCGLSSRVRAPMAQAFSSFIQMSRIVLNSRTFWPAPGRGGQHE